MTGSATSNNPIKRGIGVTVLIVSYSYYLIWLGERLEQYLPYFHSGYIIAALLPFCAALLIHLSGIYTFSFRVYRKKRLISHNTSADVYDPYGVIDPLSDYRNEIQNILQSITSNHFFIDDRLLVSLYIHGLEKVTERFWTTTYLTSGFWAHGRSDVIIANKSMLRKLFTNEKKSIRRLFLLRNSLNDEIKLIGSKISEYRVQGVRSKIKTMIEEFETLKETCNTLMGLKCEIKYYFDEVDHSSIGVIKNKTEIALYDDFRVDFFLGADDAKITGVTIFTKEHKIFNEKKDQIASYHENIWSKAMPFDILLKRLDNAYRYYSEKIDYTFPRLIKFDYDLKGNDKNLKNEEINYVKRVLEEKQFYPKIKNYLDIGTCTGRYPFKLNERLQHAVSLGIDADDDCIEYCNIQKEKHSREVIVRNIFFKKADFLYDDIAEIKFELITCMLGTISHFGWNKNEKNEDDLQEAIKKMQTLLAPTGMLIISNWTDIALNGHILDIYEAPDRQRLQNFTEKKHILLRRLEKHFTVLEPIKRTKDHYLDIIVCIHKK